jgi:hypothetical protein
VRPWLLVWLLVTLVTTVAVGVVVAALVRHVLLLGRATGRFQDEVGSMTQELSAESARASRRAESLSAQAADLGRPDRRNRPRR